MCELVAPTLLLCSALVGLLVWKVGAPQAGVALWVGLGLNALLSAGAIVSSVSTPPTSTWQRGFLAMAVLAAAALGGGIVARAGLEWAGMSEIAGTLPASAWIGVIERLTITLALLLSLPEIAALVIGVKALGQYAESTADDTPHNHSAAARILGTLLSLVWALACYASWRVAVPG